MNIRALVLTVGLALPSGPLPAEDRAGVEQQFHLWLEQSVWPRASDEGVSRSTFDDAFSGVTLDWDLPDLVPPGAAAPTLVPQSQAEFSSPASYFAPGVVGSTTAVGAEMAARHGGTLEAVARATGVSPGIILAVWGRESAYGRAQIPHNIFEILGTKGFMSTRAEYFTEELIAALRIAEVGAVPLDAMRSSWAGALGQPQFMPSSYLAFAADGDGDGRTDIWGSEADTIASIANYLARHGWVAGRDWGFEVSVPPTVSCTLEGPDQGRPIAEWEALGLIRVNGRPFPEHERPQEGYLVMPAGRHGPAFLVTPNFYVLKEYNMSDLYALFVGHIGDRIQYGVGGFQVAWGDVGGLSRPDVASIQRSLERLGHDVGSADGLAGFRTRRSIGRWQEATGQGATCFPESGMAQALGP